MIKKLLFLTVFIYSTTLTTPTYGHNKEGLTKEEAQCLYNGFTQFFGVRFLKKDKISIRGKAYQVITHPNRPMELEPSEYEDTSSDIFIRIPFEDPYCLNEQHNSQQISFKEESQRGYFSTGWYITNNENRRIEVYKRKNENSIIVEIATTNDSETELEIIREIPGNYVVIIDGYNLNAESERRLYFIVSEDEPGFQYNRGHYIGVIDIDTGTLDESFINIALQVNPVLTRNGTIYFSGTDNSLYQYKNNEITKLWDNNEGAEIWGIDFEFNREVNSLKLRKDGKDYYKFFFRAFEYVLSTEDDLAFVWFSYDSRIKPDKEEDEEINTDLGILAFIRRDSDGQTPPRIYLRRWFINREELTGEEEDTCAPEDGRYLPVLENEILLLDVGDLIDYKDFCKPYATTVVNESDGREIPVNVWPPHHLIEGKVYPMIIYVHGGPNSHVDRIFHEINFKNQVMASRGYWVVAPEARGSTGYGREHERALQNDWADGHLDDIIAVADFFKSKEEIDPDTIFLMGHSFGGYTTLTMATHPKYADYFDGYIPIALVSNEGKNSHEVSESEEWETHKQIYLDVWASRIGFNAMNDWANNEGNKRISPYYHLENVKRPVLQIHGTNDTTTLPNQATDVHAKAYDLGLPVETVMIGDIDHQFSGKNGYLGHTELPLEFFKRILEERYESKAQQFPRYVNDVEQFLEYWD